MRKDNRIAELLRDFDMRHEVHEDKGFAEHLLISLDGKNVISQLDEGIIVGSIIN